MEDRTSRKTELTGSKINFSPNFIFTVDANDREVIQRERQRAAWHEERAQTIRLHFFF